jgi:hypothetical protein
VSCAYDIASYIASTLGYGTLGTSIFVNAEYDQPDEQIVVYEYGGKPSDMAMGLPDPSPLENVSIQIMVRKNSAQNAQETAYAIYKALDGNGDVTINSVEYLFLKALQPPFLLEACTFVFNMEVQKRRS